MNASHAYARTRNETASKERLMVLLFEAALKHMRGGAAALDAGRQVDARNALTRAGDIVAELSATLDLQAAPALAPLKDVYAFVCARLLAGATRDDVAAVREAERAFEPISSAFSSAVDQLGARP